MRVVIPMQQGRFSEHFGGADAFAFYTVDMASQTVAERVVGSPPEHGRGIYPMWLRSQGAEVIVAGGMGPRAIDMLAQHGIDVVLGVQGTDPDTVVRQYVSGTLQATGEVCHDHSYHDCGHNPDGQGHGHGGRGGCHDG